MHVLLTTERLVLRRFTAADLDELYALDNDREVMRYINGGLPVSRELIAQQILPDFLTYDERFPVSGFWAMIERAGGDFLGWVSLRPAGEPPAAAILGYRLHRKAWGNGYAVEGARALLDRGFSEPGLQRVIATTYQDNLASRRVMEKLGMTLRRRFRLSAADLAQIDSCHVGELELWDGDDLEYVLEKDEHYAIIPLDGAGVGLIEMKDLFRSMGSPSRS